MVFNTMKDGHIRIETLGTIGTESKEVSFVYLVFVYVSMYSNEGRTLFL